VISCTCEILIEHTQGLHETYLQSRHGEGVNVGACGEASLPNTNFGRKPPVGVSNSATLREWDARDVLDNLNRI
jgi:hypothetical protein